MEHVNWAGNLRYSNQEVAYPTTVEQVQKLVRQASTVKALGSRHSFNPIADSTGTHISLQHLNRVVSLDTVAHTVTVEGGMRYGELAPLLQAKGYALHNPASLPHISIVGACATATHGSGLHSSNLATAVSALELVTATGEVVSLSREQDGELLKGAVVNLGALGVVTKITLQLRPAFYIKQVVYRNLPMQALEQHFMAVMSSGYSVSLFTTWQNRTINQVWVKSVAEGSAAEISSDFYGATPASQNMHPLEEMSAENATEQLGVPGLWYERLPHFKMGFLPSAGAELQSEYFVPVGQAYEALLALERLHPQISPHLFVSEIRTIAADDLWLSPQYRKATVAFHFTWKQNWAAVQKLLPLIEAALDPFGAVPHWGKLFTMAPALLQDRLPKLADFRQLMQTYDPAGKFRNQFLENNLFGGRA